MRKLVIILGITVLFLAGCFQKPNEKVDNPRSPIPKEPIKEDPIVIEDPIFKPLQTDQSTFHFVADWLTETKIVFVEKKHGLYSVKTFDLDSGDVEILFEDTSIVVDVLIHPSKEYLLLHTTDDPTAATIKLLSLDGIIHKEVIVESSELAIEWNSLDPMLILLTAFYQDWTFDVFSYDGHQENLNLISIEEPFPKWYGTEKVIGLDSDGHPLDGATLMIFDRQTNTWTRSALSDVVYFDTYGESILSVRILNETDALYSITDLEGKVASEWMMPAVSNYSEWVFPEISWVSDELVFIPSPENGGQLDDLPGPYRLIRVDGGEQKVVTEEITVGVLRCNSDGEKCLTGSWAEKLIDLEENDEVVWIQYSE